MIYQNENYYQLIPCTTGDTTAEIDESKTGKR